MNEKNNVTCQLEHTLEQPTPVIQPFGLKYEATSRGYRIHVSVHCESIEQCRQSALQLLIGAETDLRNHCIPIAGNGNGSEPAAK